MKKGKILKQLYLMFLVLIAGFSICVPATFCSGFGTEAYADGENSYSLTAGTFANNQRGSMYSHIDGVGVHILHSWEAAPISRFVGVKLNGVKNTTIADADLIVFRIDVTAATVNSLRVQYGTAAAQNKGFVMDSPDGTFASTTVAATRVTKATKYLAFPVTAASLASYDYVKIFENINTIGAWSKFTIGDVYAAKKNGEGNGLAAYEKIWSVDFETANYEAYYVDYTTGDNAEADATKIFDVRALHAGEFWVSPGALELKNPDDVSVNGSNLLNYNLSESAKSALRNGEGKYDMSLLKGFVVDVRNTSGKDTKLFLAFNGGITGSARKVLLVPDGGDAYWSLLKLPKDFAGKVVIPYTETYMGSGLKTGTQDTIAEYVQIQTIPGNAAYSDTSFIVDGIELMTDLSQFNDGTLINLTVGENGTANATCGDVLIARNTTVTVTLSPDAGFYAESVTYKGNNLTVTDDTVTVDSYDGSEITVTFAQIPPITVETDTLYTIFENNPSVPDGVDASTDYCLIVFASLNESAEEASEYGIEVEYNGNKYIYKALVKSESGKFAVALYGIGDGTYTVRAYACISGNTVYSVNAAEYTK